MEETIHHFQVGATPGLHHKSRAASDEYYIMRLAGELLGESPRHGYRFPWLKGDAGTLLPVDGYFPEHNLVVEFWEGQHLAHPKKTYKLWDAKQTVSRMSRLEQRAKYDELRKTLIPKHGLRLIIIKITDFPDNLRGRLRREHDRDREILTKLLRDQ